MKRRSTFSDRGRGAPEGERRRDLGAAAQLRLQVAQETARLMASGLHAELEPARRKAAARLGVRDPSQLPDAGEILEALATHQRLYGRPQAASDLRRLRAAALEAMPFFAAFEPRLAGPVLAGTATTSTAVCLHLHPLHADEVARFLHDQRIPAQQATRRVRLGPGRAVDLPCWEFLADGVAFELLVLPPEALRQPPLDALDGTALPRAGIAALRRLVDADPSAHPG
jgi:hypothetical protein